MFRTPLFFSALIFSVSPFAAVASSSAAEFSSPPSFVNDVEPLLTRLGCNQGVCHGKGVGQNGFRLSLRGYAPELDHGWLTREYAGRRVSLVAPDDSLILTKPLGEASHAGGKLLRRGTPSYELLRAWIVAGAPGPLAEERQLVNVVLTPDRRRAKVGETFNLQVSAEYDDGSRRDVTWLTQFASNDAGVASVDPQGHVRIEGSGETALQAQFQGRVAVAIVTVPYDRPEPKFDFATNNFIDQHVQARLRELRIPASPRCDDAAFARRAYLDVLGTLPTETELRAFLADQRADKRAQLIDALLARPEFVDYWTLVWSDLFQNRKERDHDVRGTKGVRSFHYWLREQIAADVPWDQLTARVLTASGPTREHPEIGYYVVTIGEQRNPAQSDVVAAVAQAFLGVRVGCAKCHNHPLEKYTQDDYYRFAACFGRVSFERQKPEVGPTTLLLQSENERGIHRRRENAQKKLAELEALKTPEDPAEAKKHEQQLASQQKQVEDATKQLESARTAEVSVHQPRTGKPMTPHGLDRKPLVDESSAGDPRAALVRWMTDGRNADFNGAIVNRLWKHFLGTGLVEPVDDLRVGNPPTNPELWKALCDELVANKFNLKHLMRVILNSETYQRSSRTLHENETDARYYSHFYARRLPAEVLLDAIGDVTGVADRFPGYPAGMRAVQLPDPGLDSYFLTLFGRSARTTACACERQGEVTMSQLLHLQNGDTVLQKLESGEGRLPLLLKSQPDDHRVVETLFLETLGRLPTATEREQIATQLKSGDPREEVYRDLLWSLLNSKEFAFNH